ncbi:cytochrome P450 [Xylaria cf. heliscus]|nr:cytochrome P450 [Xylaria cf. heliscus]
MTMAVISNIYIWTALVVIASVYVSLTKRWRRPNFPIVNDYKNDFFHRKAYAEFNRNAKGLIADGLKQHGGPIAVFVPGGGKKIVLPSSLSDWVTANKDLDHQELIREEFFGSYPGFESLYIVHHPDRMLIDTVRAKLSQNESTLPVLNEHIVRALEKYWGDSEAWHGINWTQGTTGVISLAAASVFVGPEEAESPEWQTLIQSYVSGFFAAVGELHRWQPWLRPVVQWFLPHCTAIRSMVPRSRAILREVVRKRTREAEAAVADGREPPSYNDAVSWVMSNPDAKVEHGDFQLALGMAALFTTTDVLRRVLIEIARHQEIIQPLREEIRQQFKEGGLKLNTIFKLELLDSVMKEAQRMASALVGLERKVIRDTVLPDGTRIPKGSHLAVDSSDMWNPTVYENPDVFDGYRFLKRRQDAVKASQFVQSSQEHNAFGGGRHLCPGRFFANNELKLCLAHIITKYDIRLRDGYESKSMNFGFYVVIDPFTQLEVRRRIGEEDII